MSDIRMVAMTAEQHEEIEHYIQLLMRGHRNERAASMMNLALAYKFAKKNEPELPSNVVPLVTHAGNNWSRKAGA